MVVRQLDLMLSKYALALQKIYWFAYLQMLWLLFTLCGLIVFGIFPATYALLTMFKDAEELSAREAFHKYKTIFVSSFKTINKAGMIWQSMLFLVATNLLIIPNVGILVQATVIGVLGLTILGIIHFFHYFEMDKSSLFQIKRAFSFVFLQPRENVGYMLILVLLLLATQFIPGITFFYGISTCAYFVAKIGKYEHRLN